MSKIQIYNSENIISVLIIDNEEKSLTNIKNYFKKKSQNQVLNKDTNY